MFYSYSTWLPLFPKKSSWRGTVSFGRNSRFHGNHLKKVDLAVKKVFWLSIGLFKVYLPPLNPLQGLQWHHYYVARGSGCLATDIQCYISLETRANINHRDNWLVPAPSKVTPRIPWCHILVTRVHSCPVTEDFYLATKVKCVILTDMTKTTLVGTVWQYMEIYEATWQYLGGLWGYLTVFGRYVRLPDSI